MITILTGKLRSEKYNREAMRLCRQKGTKSATCDDVCRYAYAIKITVHELERNLFKGIRILIILQFIKLLVCRNIFCKNQ